MCCNKVATGNSSGTSLAPQQCRLQTPRRGPGFDPCSGNKIPQALPIPQRELQPTPQSGKKKPDSCLDSGSTLAWKIPWTEEPGRLQAVHGVARSQTRLSDFTFTLHCHALEKDMATHTSVLAWRIPGTGEPGGLLSMGWHRVGHD